MIPNQKIQIKRKNYENMSTLNLLPEKKDCDGQLIVKPKIKLKVNSDTQCAKAVVETLHHKLGEKIDVKDIKLVIKPSDNELREKLKEICSRGQKKHVGVRPKFRLKLITKPKFQLQIFDLKNIVCDSIYLCKNDQCQRCYDLSFASAPNQIIERWSLENTLKPRDVRLNESKEYWFDCSHCKHRYLKSPKEIKRPPGSKKKEGAKIDINKWLMDPNSTFGCPKCGGQEMCDDNDCQSCEQSSFMSSHRAKNWSKHKVDGVSLNGDWFPRYVYRAGTFVAWFDCDECNHVFEISLNDVNRGRWCPYCCAGGQKKYCKNHDCNWCHNYSYASHPKSICWAETSIGSHQVALNSNDKFRHNCDQCLHKFQASPHDINNLKTWCPICKNKTELKLYKWLLSVTNENIVIQAKYDWCRSNVTCSYLSFDFVIEKFKLIIELDGNQHFYQISNWNPPDKTQENDVYKMKCAINNGYSIIRLLQNDVWYDKNNWNWKLQPSLKLQTQPTIIYIENGNCYDAYKTKFENYCLQ